MKKLLLPVMALIIGLGTYAHALCSKTDLICYKVSGTQKFRVTSAGLMYSAGGSNITGDEAVSGQLNTGGNLVVGGQSILIGDINTYGYIRTPTTAPYGIVFSSATATIPGSTPAAAGIVAVTNTYVMYISTGTGVGAWVKVGGQ